MFDALSIAATGMQAQQLNLDTIANNLVNINTAGFKKGHVSFTDLMTVEASRMEPTGNTPEVNPLSSSPRVGAGVGISSVTKNFDAGSITQTGSAWDVAIQGDGFLQVTMPDGTLGYMRGGSLKVNSDGMLVTQSGQPLKPNMTVPTSASNVLIASDGTVSVTVPNQSTPLQIGQLQLVRFANPGSLIAQGDNLYRISETSGEPIVGTPGQDGLGTLQQGYQEGSNVKMVDEMVNLMVAQRTYQASVKVVQASDEILGMINNLRK